MIRYKTYGAIDHLAERYSAVLSSEAIYFAAQGSSVLLLSKCMNSLTGIISMKLLNLDSTFLWGFNSLVLHCTR